jgi:lipopolysaccharide cholinephosphotransferase
VLNKTIAYLLYPTAYTLRIIGNIWAKCSNNQELMFSWGSNFNSRRYLDEVFPLSEIEFENHKFYVPYNTHIYLERIYGDYMKLPEESKRQIHMDVESMKFNIYPSAND